jgi:hypothetical protein
MKLALLISRDFMAKKKKLQHGGARKGAGRPRKAEGSKVVTLTVTVPSELAANLETFVEAKRWKRSKAVTEALAAMLKRKMR